MNMQKSQNRIRELMLKFLTEVDISNAMDMRDINLVSENVLIPLFSEVYGYSDLKNLNVSEGPNFPAIDLGDEKTRTAYQITSESGSAKIKDTLKKFVAHKLYKKFDRLIIYILAKKQETYRGREFDKIINGKFCFNKETDILDYRDLLKEISGFPLEKLLKIETILEQHFGEESTSWHPLDWLKKVNQSMDENTDQKSTIRINREKPLNDLKNFVSQGNGVIIGSPGIGKTYLLRELCQSLKSVEMPRLFLPIDQLGDGTQEDLSNALPDGDDLIEKLKSIPVSNKKAILLFDAFDAARNERTRKRFLRLIRRAIQELDKWNVVVTVRTYDAKKSQELLDLFGNPNTDLKQYHTEGILCRHFTIPPLNDGEIRQAFNQIEAEIGKAFGRTPDLKSIYESGAQDFKCLLANPFNLWLLEKILTISQDVPDFSQIHSEVQLLRLFWQRRIEATNNGIHHHSLLTKVARLMIGKRSLTVRQEDVYEGLDLDKPVRKKAWEDLMSNEILAKASSTGQRIAFSHNILFDYAISILLIEDDPQKLEDFVNEDPSRPLFLRPSLTYFCTRLWYDVPESFWKAFWHILPKDRSVHLSLFARLVPTSVIANEARDTVQLEPLLKKLQKGEDIANEAMMRLLQSLRALQIERDAFWIDFFSQVSAYWHADFAGDLSTLTSEILERATKANNTVTINTCGKIGRRLFEWVWEARETNGDDWYNRIGSSRAVPLIAKTYGTNVESRPLLEKVLELMQEDNFPISFLTWLTGHVDKIWIHDPEFVALTYHAVFTYNETSDERTSLSSGPILPLTSTRQQDYSSCQYRLVRHFPNFLQVDSLAATQAAIRSLNYFIKKNHIDGYLKDGVNFENLRETFEFRGKHAYFVPDNSHIWDETSYSAKPIEIADELFKFIASLASSQNSLLDSLLDVFRDEVQVAFFWKRLLKTAVQSPRVFAPLLFELCSAKPIQLSNDALYELGLFLENAADEFTPSQLRQIEDTILTLPEEATDEDDRKFLERRRNRLLVQIPLNLLQTDDAKKIREEIERIDQVPENKPLANFTSWSEPYTEENRLQDQGVDTDAPENQELQRFFRPMDKFTSDWLNGTPTEEAVEEILPQLQEAYATIHRNAEVDKAVIDSLWCKLSACVAILSRVADNLDTGQFAFCRQILLQGATHELPKPDPHWDAQFNFPSYSSSPRLEAAQGLPRLSTHQPDLEILDAIESLSSDSVPSIRMITAKELSRVYFRTPERFWHIIEHRATYETNQIVQEYLYFTLAQVVGRKKENEDKTVRIMDKLLQRIPQPISSIGQSDSFIVLLMWLAINCENPWALKTIDDTLFKDPIRFANSLSSAVSRTMDDYIVPKNLEMSNKRREETQRAIAFLKQAIDVASDGVRELCTNFNENGTEEEKKKLRDIYTVIDQIIMHLFFQIAYEKDQSEEPTEKITDEVRCRFYNEIKPLMEQVIAFAEGENGVMFAPTAHHFMELLTSCLSCNPKEVLHLAAGVARSSERFGYNLDSLAVAEVVKFVEIILADHREEVRDGQGLKDLLALLDIFAKTGWSDALRLVWRLDEVFR